MAEDTFEIRKEQVYARDESGAKLFGWERSELILFGVVALATQSVFHSGKATVSAIALAYVYVRTIKKRLPERFLTNATRFYLRRHLLYRAAGRDTQWRPPIAIDRSSSRR